jgi:hypothetical protein
MIIQNPLFTEEIPEKGAARGHVRFASSSSKPEDVALMGFCANVAASVLFERMQAQGTNIIITIDKDSSRIDVLARAENDGLNFLWTPKPAERVDEIQERIRNKTFFFGKEDKSGAKTESRPEQHEPTTHAPASKTPDQASPDDEDDYLVKQLHRIP